MEKFETGARIVWRPSPELIARSNLKRFMDRHRIDSFDALMQRSTTDIAWFWDSVMQELDIRFNRPYSQIVDVSRGIAWARWCVGGQMNIIDNCLDKHAGSPTDSRIALRWEGEEGAVRTLSYLELRQEVNRAANGLRSLGLGKGDTIGVFMPMTPETVIAMLAIIKIGGLFVPLFSGFGAQAVASRLADADAKALVTADGMYRRGRILPMKPTADEAVTRVPTIRHVLVLERTGTEVPWNGARDHWWHDLIPPQPGEAPTERTEAEDILMLLYTSGTTGKPKGVVHTTAGYSVGIYSTAKWVFDLKEEDTYWCTADIGWVTGHSYIVYGPLLNGTTSLMYEGAPNFPEPDRFWNIIDRHKVNVFYTAPTAIRTFIKWGDQWPKKHKLDSLRLLGTVGEPINPEAWMWYREVIGHDRCPIVDTWWQTETGHIMISPIPGAVATKPGSATRPIPGVVPEIVNMQGEPVPDGSGGFLVIKQPWPGMLRTIYGDPDRYVKQYWSQIPGVYFTGDGARKDKDGYFWIMGRVDDVINVSGHRLSTMEVESALVAHDAVAEAAVVGRPDDLKGQAISAFVTLEHGQKPTLELKEELKKWVAKEIGALAKPDDIRFTDTLPKTRSGKIMRRLLRELATNGEVKGDTTTLEDFSVLAKLKESEEA